MEMNIIWNTKSKKNLRRKNIFMYLVYRNNLTNLSIFYYENNNFYQLYLLKQIKTRWFWRLIIEQ